MATASDLVRPEVGQHLQLSLSRSQIENGFLVRPLVAPVSIGDAAAVGSVMSHDSVVGNIGDETAKRADDRVCRSMRLHAVAAAMPG